MSTGSEKILLSELADGVACITLNRPEKRNALDPEARQALLQALDATRETARVIVLKGAGGTFCSGMDLSQVTGGGIAEEEQLNRSWVQVQEEIRRHPAILIASVRGYALGGGFTLINACDLAVVSKDAQLGMPEVGFGFYPGLAGPAAQLRLSSKRAGWMILTARRIDGQTAVDWGAANLAVPDEDVDAEATALATHVAQFDRYVLEYTKKALWEIPSHITDWRTALEFGAYTNAQIHARTDSHRSGLENFAAGKPNPGQGRSGE